MKTKIVLKKTTILTGFLGAGKTTYLNHLLKSNPNTKYAIIENEFGEVGIDGDLIIRSNDSIVEMNNGCLCCSLNENLYELLSDLHSRKDDFDELIIEATGIADPANIAEPFIIHPAVKNTFKLVNTICIIDSEQIEDRLKDTEEAIKQIAFSDVLLLVKTDLVSPNYVEQLKIILKGINPFAQVLTKENGVYPTILPSSIKHNHVESTSDCKHHHDEKCDHHQEHKTTITHQHKDIVTLSFVFNETFNIEEMQHQLFVFLTFQSKDIYRFKGIVYGGHPLKKYLIQSVGKRMGTEELQFSEDIESGLSKFVFIGKNIKPDGLRKLLERCKTKTNVNLA